MKQPNLDLLARTRSILEDVRRVKNRPRLQRPRPDWLRGNGALVRAEAEREALFASGRLVKGWLVMANSLAFVPGNQTYPAVVVYDPRDALDAELLQEAARGVFAQRGAKPVDADLAALAKALDEPVWTVLGMRVPPAIALGHELRVGTVLLHRTDLPRRYAAANLLPLLVHEASPSVVVLPEAFWADDLRSAWRDLAAEPR